jgi:hypothetical protein
MGRLKFLRRWLRSGVCYSLVAAPWLAAPIERFAPGVYPFGREPVPTDEDRKRRQRGAART